MTKKSSVKQPTLPMEAPTLGARLKSIRKFLGMTTTDFAEAVGTHDSSVSQWENDVNVPTLARIAKICEYLCIPIDALIEGLDIGTIKPKPKEEKG